MDRAMTTLLMEPPDEPADELTNERRAAPRSMADELPWPLACRITPGRDVRVLNVSAIGLLVESSRALSPGRTITLHLQTDTRRAMVNGLIVRSCMTGIDRERGALFASAIAFERRCDLTVE
jgi:hypothetical protein